MHPYRIRPAVSADVLYIQELISELARFEKAENEFTATAEMLHAVLFGKEPWVWAWVAECDGEIRGMAIAYRRYSTWKGPVLYLEDFVVKEKFRSCGIGAALFETCLGFARHQGFAKLVWQVLDWNVNAQRFYQRYDASFDKGWWNGSIDLSS